MALTGSSVVCVGFHVGQCDVFPRTALRAHGVGRGVATLWFKQLWQAPVEVTARGLPAQVAESFARGDLGPAGVGSVTAVTCWQQAEELAAAHMRDLGFTGVRLTRAGADGGVDVVADGAAAQVKHIQGKTIGAPVVQQLRGAAFGVGWPLFYTVSSYSQAAVRTADEVGIALFTYTPDAQVWAANQHAGTLVTHARRTLPPASRTATNDQVRALRHELELAQQEYGTLWARCGAHPSGLVGPGLQSVLATIQTVALHLDSGLQTSGQAVADLKELQACRSTTAWLSRHVHE